MKRLLVQALVLAASLQHPFATQAADEDDAPALDHFVGTWQADTINKPAKWTPEGGTHSDSEHTIHVLKKQFILTYSIRQPQNVKGLWIMGYEPQASTYPFLLFDSKGVSGAQWRGVWDAPRKTITFKATDMPRGWTGQATNHFPDKETNQIAYKIKDETGALLLDGGGTKTRQPDDAGQEILDAWSEASKPESPASDEMQAIQWLNGSWNFTAVSRRAEWTPDEVRTTGTLTRKWAMDNHFILETSKESSGHEGMVLFAYEPNQKAYQQWWFSSDGYTGQTSGQWDEVSETLSMTSDLGDGITTKLVIRYIDADHHDARVVIRDKNGKLYFDKKWIMTRQAN